MNLVTFTYIEEYIEFIAGQRELDGKMSITWYMPTPRINLARYDVGFISSVANQTVSHLGLSEKQANLAMQLIRTYQRQLTKLGVGQPNFDNPQFRIPVRYLNYDKTIALEQGMVYVRFPFNSDLIAEVKAAIKESHGTFTWLPTEKAWTLGITESNINWAVTFGNANGFTISQEINDLFELILECEKTPYAIELQRNTDGVYCVVNAPESLNDYVEKHVGFTNRNKLVDMASVLGYTISNEIFSEVAVEYGPAFMSFCSSRDIFCPPDKKNSTAVIEEVVQWAIAVDRLPIIVYNPLDVVSEGMFDWAKKYFADSEIAVLKNQPTRMSDHQGIPNEVVDSNVKIIYTNKVVRTPAKLLITYTSMMFGPDKLEWVQSIEKVVRYCEKMR